MKNSVKSFAFVTLTPVVNVPLCCTFILSPDKLSNCCTSFIFHIAALFKAFFNLANTESFSRKNDPDWIKENSEELCKIFLHWTEFFLLRIYEKGTHRNKAKRSIGQEFGYGVSFNKELMEYSLEDMNYFEILDLCRSRIELIKSYLIPNYFIHTKNEFTRKIIERFTGINIEKIHI